MIAASHQGPRAQKIAWIDNNTVVTAGFNPNACREFAVWDLKNLDQPMAKGDIQDGTGVSHIHFDREHELLFNVGRGDSYVQYWQYDRSAPRMMTPLDTWRSSSSTKAFTWLPKWALDVNKHEVQRAARVTSDKTLEMVGFRLPSKSGLFQPDLYPSFASNTANGNVEDWLSGTNKPPITMELRPEKKKTNAKKAGGLASLLKGEKVEEKKE